jgi:hypothetical protein
MWRNTGIAPNKRFFLAQYEYRAKEAPLTGTGVPRKLVNQRPRRVRSRMEDDLVSILGGISHQIDLIDLSASWTCFWDMSKKPVLFGHIFTICSFPEHVPAGDAGITHRSWSRHSRPRTLGFLQNYHVDQYALVWNQFPPRPSAPPAPCSQRSPSSATAFVSSSAGRREERKIVVWFYPGQRASGGLRTVIARRSRLLP